MVSIHIYIYIPIDLMLVQDICLYILGCIAKQVPQTAWRICLELSTGEEEEIRNDGDKRQPRSPSTR